MTTKIFLGLLAIAWLIPNHYTPWSSAWNEALAIFGLLLITLTTTVISRNNQRVSRQLLWMALVCCVILLVQRATGLLVFSGDAWMVSLYVGLWLLGVMVGGALVHHQDGLSALPTTWLWAAVLSVGVGLVQWTGAFSLGIYGAELPPGGRPFGNVAQPNHLCTICFLGLCGLFWLHQQKRIRTAIFWLGASFLLFGMVMTQSRTGWVQIFLFTAWVLLMQIRANLSIGRWQALTIFGLFFFGVLIWSPLSESLLLSTGRSLSAQIQAGARLPYWQSTLDAIFREPLWGYGWQQIGAAQQRVALDHPGIGTLFEHSHNLMLDLWLWNGVPAGSLLIGILGWWFLAHIRHCRDARVAWLLLAIGGVFVHAMLEFPLEYAYFLIPVGLAMGAVDGLSPNGAGRVFRVHRWLLLTFTLMLSAVFIAIGGEYLKAEENYRALRMESARIGATRLETPAPQLRLLTQLGAFLQFARTEAAPGMAPEQVEWMRKVSERFGHPPVLFRYALAAGLNGQPEAAKKTLERICRIHPVERCSEAREGWTALQSQYPQLQATPTPGGWPSQFD